MEMHSASFNECFFTDSCLYLWSYLFLWYVDNLVLVMQMPWKLLWHKKVPSCLCTRRKMIMFFEATVEIIE